MSNELINVNDESRENEFGFLLRLIPTGEENAVSMLDLANSLRTTERGVRRLVTMARLSNNIICSTGAGYFIPNTYRELEKYYHISRARLLTCARCLKPVERLLEQRKDLSDYYETIF